MRLAFVTRHTDLSRVRSFEPDAFVLLDPIIIEGSTLLPEELGEEVMVLDEPPFGILDDFKGSLEAREIAFDRRPRYVVFKSPRRPGYVRIDGITFINASLGAVVDGYRVYVPRRSRGIVLYTLMPETPRRIPEELLKEPPRERAYKEYEDPHLKRIAMFARSFMERRVYVRRPRDESIIKELEGIERPVFFDLEFDARALKRGYTTEDPIIRVASYHDGRLRKFFIRDNNEERRFLEEISKYEAIIGYGTSGDERILRKAAERYGIEIPRIIDLQAMLFPKDPRKQRIALPCGRKRGLKTVAEALGFKRTSDKDGRRAYKAYLEAKRRGRPKRLVSELIRYNAEDTLMTSFVYNKVIKALNRLIE